MHFVVFPIAFLESDKAREQITYCNIFLLALGKINKISFGSMGFHKCGAGLGAKMAAFCIVLFDNFVAFGDAILDYIASFVTIFDTIDFEECDDYMWCSDADMELREFKKEMLNAHNDYRTLHGCPPLVLSEELTGTAQSWAEKLADRGILQYSENPSVGENVCVVDLDSLKTRKGEEIVNEWYKEISRYNYSDPGWKRDAYRASQLLWKSTNEIGVGIAKVPGQRKAFVVANYRPAGNNNMPGEFERNVLPPQKKSDENANLRKNMIRRH